jgi:hypothetical protein
MRSLAFIVLSGVLVSLTGCRQPDSIVEAAEELQLFEKGKGLRLPEETIKALGVETVEVIEKPAGGEAAHRDDSPYLVPEPAVIRGATGAFVYVANGEHFTRTPVKMGRVADGQAEILDGLYAGDVVVWKAAEPLWMVELYALRGGVPCCPVPKKTAAAK